MRVITQFGKTKVQPSGRDDAITMRKNTAGSTYTRRIVNVIEGSNTTLTLAESDANDEINLTVASSGGTSIIGGGSPSIAAGTGAGSPASVSITGTDKSGLIAITTGTGTATNSPIFTVTFSSAFASNPGTVVLMPADGTTAAQAVSSRPIASSPSTTSWTLTSNTTAMPVSTLFQWYYFIPY